MLAQIGTFELILAGSGIIFMISLFFVILYFLFTRKVTKKQLENNQLKLSHQKELLKNEIIAIEKERQRFACDLHDEVGANLAYVLLNLSQLTTQCDESSMKETLQSCEEQIKNTIKDVRRISHDLRPPSLEMFGLVSAIQQFIDQINSNIDIQLRSNTPSFELDPYLSIQLYRVILEIINNAIKYSNGTLVEIDIQLEEKELIIDLKDDGIGFVFDEKIKENGLGLKNIVNRLEAIDAEFIVKDPPKGSHFVIKSNNISHEKI